LAHRHANPTHTLFLIIHTPTHILFHTHLFTRNLTNTCILTHHSSMLGFSFLLFLVCPAFVHKARVMARFLFLDSGLCFNHSSWKQSPKPGSVSEQRKAEVIPVKGRVPQLVQTHYLQELAQAFLLCK
jgi:hypothetical protein